MWRSSRNPLTRPLLWKILETLCWRRLFAAVGISQKSTKSALLHSPPKLSKAPCNDTVAHSCARHLAQVKPKGQKILVARAKHNLHILVWESQDSLLLPKMKIQLKIWLPSANQKISCLNFPGQVRLRLLLRSLAQFAVQNVCKRIKLRSGYGPGQLSACPKHWMGPVCALESLED